MIWQATRNFKMPKKKVKVLKKKKVKEVKKKTKIKNVKKKTSIKKIKKGAEIKEIKNSNLKSNIGNLEGEINEESFSQILQPSRGPVLEQIAVAGGNNLENIIPIRETSNEDLSDVKRDYTQIGNLNDEKNKYQESSPNYDDTANLDEDEKERRKNLGLKDFEFEKLNKKYVNKGDYQ